MNWLIVAFPLMGIYVLWFGYQLYKRKYDRALLLFGLAHIPYLLVNLVAPFRGVFDPEYAGYSMGLITLPKGIWVPLVVGTVVVVSFLLATRAFQNRMEKLWKIAFGFDLLLVILVAIPIVVDMLGNLDEFAIELGEYMRISGWVATGIIFLLFTLPTSYACYLSGRRAFLKV